MYGGGQQWGTSVSVKHSGGCIMFGAAFQPGMLGIFLSYECWKKPSKLAPPSNIYFSGWQWSDCKCSKIIFWKHRMEHYQSRIVLEHFWSSVGSTWQRTEQQKSFECPSRFFCIYSFSSWSNIKTSLVIWKHVNFTLGTGQVLLISILTCFFHL